MEINTVNRVHKETFEHLLAGIPFFKGVKHDDVEQYELLLQSSRVATYSPSSVVLKKGEQDFWIYFLLKGRLAVYIDNPGLVELVNHITPGEVFGDISQLLNLNRSATLIADPNTRETMVLALDSRIFTPLTSFHSLSLKTKLAYYRNMAHNFRWKLEVYRAQNLQHVLANKHRLIKLYQGEKDTVGELLALHQQSSELAQLLIEWNAEFGVQSKSQ